MANRINCQIENIFDTNLDFDPIPDVIHLAGVTFENRQNLIKEIWKDSKIELIRDPFNPHDRYAIKVMAYVANNKKIQIGWIPKNFAQVLAPEIDAGIQWNGIVKEVIGGGEKNYGILVNLSYKKE